MFTVDMLIEKKACIQQIRIFKETFPNGANLSVDTALGVATLFDWGFAAFNFLSKDGWKAYEEAEAPLWKAYKEAQATLFAEIYLKEKGV